MFFYLLIATLLNCTQMPIEWFLENKLEDYPVQITFHKLGAPHEGYYPIEKTHITLDPGEKVLYPYKPHIKKATFTILNQYPSPTPIWGVPTDKSAKITFKEPHRANRYDVQEIEHS